MTSEEQAKQVVAIWHSSYQPLAPLIATALREREQRTWDEAIEIVRRYEPDERQPGITYASRDMERRRAHALEET